MISLSKGKDANVLKKRAPYSSAFHLSEGVEKQNAYRSQNRPKESEENK